MHVLCNAGMHKLTQKCESHNKLESHMKFIFILKITLCMGPCSGARLRIVMAC